MYLFNHHFRSPSRSTSSMFCYYKFCKQFDKLTIALVVCHLRRLIYFRSECQHYLSRIHVSTFHNHASITFDHHFREIPEHSSDVVPFTISAINYRLPTVPTYSRRLNRHRSGLFVQGSFCPHHHSSHPVIDLGLFIVYLLHLAFNSSSS